LNAYQFDRLAEIDEFPDGVWERLDGVNRLDWLNSPYRFPRRSTAFESRLFRRDTPVLWVGWSSEIARRVCRLAGWMHLVAMGKVGGGIAMPLAPLLTRALVSVTPELAAVLLQKFCLFFHTAEVDTATMTELFKRCWMPLLSRPSLPANQRLLYLLACTGGTHSLRSRAVTELTDLLRPPGDKPEFKPLLRMCYELNSAATAGFTGEFFPLDADLRTRLLCAICESTHVEEIAKWSNTNWRVLVNTPAAHSFQVGHNVCWAEPTGPSRLAEYIRQGVPLPLLRMVAAFSHRVRTSMLPLFQRIAATFQLHEGWVGVGASDGFTALRSEVTHAFLHTVLHQPEAVRNGLVKGIEEHWRVHEPHVVEQAPWADAPSDFLAPFQPRSEWEPTNALAAITALESLVRGSRCRWAGLTWLHAMYAKSFPLAKDAGTWLWPDDTLPLLVDCNSVAAAGPYMREVMRRGLPLNSIQLNPTSPAHLGHGNMDVEVALTHPGDIAGSASQ